MNSGIKYIKKKVDNVLIISTLAKIIIGNFENFNEEEVLILKSIRRAVPELCDKSTEEISEYLQGFEEDQLLGLANNVKGILHEIQFVEIENNDGDEITAALFTDINHPDTDVLLTNKITGEISEVQLKSTESESYVKDWINNHDEGEILVTEEIAEKMDLETSGLSNNELTIDVDNFVNKLVEMGETDELWDYVPALSAITIAISGFYLFKKYKNGMITFSELKWKFAKLTGMKLAKFGLIAGLMMIPIINVLVGAGLIYSLLYNTGTLANKYVP